MNLYTLDACAVLAMTYQEQGCDIIGNIYEDAVNGKAKLIMHKVNLLEVFKIITADGITQENLTTYRKIWESPIEFVDTSNFQFFTEFSNICRICSTHFADTFVIATNVYHTNNQGTIITSDRQFQKANDIGHTKVLFFK
jgi:hypothetical protein